MSSTPRQHAGLAEDYVGNIRRGLQDIEKALRQAKNTGGVEQTEALATAAKAAGKLHAAAEELAAVLKPYRDVDG